MSNFFPDLEPLYKFAVILFWFAIASIPLWVFLIIKIIIWLIDHIRFV